MVQVEPTDTIHKSLFLRFFKGFLHIFFAENYRKLLFTTGTTKWRATHPFENIIQIRSTLITFHSVPFRLTKVWKRLILLPLLNCVYGQIRLRMTSKKPWWFTVSVPRFGQSTDVWLPKSPAQIFAHYRPVFPPILMIFFSVHCESLWLRPCQKSNF